MSNYAKNFPVEGTAALRVDAETVERTQIIAFPGQARRPLHAKQEDLASENKLRNVLSSRFADVIERSDMIGSLRFGTCKGKAVGGLTSLQAAGASLVFFVFLMGTLLFV